MLPDPEVAGVLISACASTQTTNVSLLTERRPDMDPVATLWSPPKVRTKLPSLACSFTLLRSSLHTVPTKRGRLAPGN